MVALNERTFKDLVNHCKLMEGKCEASAISNMDGSASRYSRGSSKSMLNIVKK